MNFVDIKCDSCLKKYRIEVKRYNEAKKYHWKHYCSINCQSLSKNKQIKIKCGNPLCINYVLRNPSNIPKSRISYCSCSCAAIVNNKKFPKKRKKIRTCPKCGKNFIGRRKYCSPNCFPEHEIYSAEKIIEDIKNFYKKNERVPFKYEYFHARAARLRFGTWNKAIQAAGLKPNPVMFANKFVANDGHKCDSLSETIIDNMLFARKISHERNAPYLNTLFTADFKIKDTYIEFFGLHNELKRYDHLMKIKLKIIKDNNLKLIAIYPKDIRDKSRLSEILDDIINC